MKRFMLLALGFILVLCAWALAANQSVPVPAKIATTTKEGPAKVAPSRIVRMRATGIIVEITGTTIKIDRTVKENTEFMEFALEKPVSSIKVGDHVNISYITRNGGNVAIRIYPVKKYTIPSQQKTGSKDAKKIPEKTSPGKEASSVKK